MNYLFRINPVNRGFSLIELLVVITIIGILAGALTISFNKAREMARDSKRQADLKELQLALELYKSQHRVYPDPGCGSSGWNGPGPGDNYAACDEYIADLAPEFIEKLPIDPNQDDSNDHGYLYYVSPTRDSYKVLIWRTVETKLVESYDHPFARCPSGNGTSWCPNDDNPQSDTYAIYSRGEEFR